MSFQRLAQDTYVDYVAGYVAGKSACSSTRTRKEIERLIAYALGVRDSHSKTNIGLASKISAEIVGLKDILNPSQCWAPEQIETYRLYLKAFASYGTKDPNDEFSFATDDTCTPEKALAMAYALDRSKVVDITTLHGLIQSIQQS